MVGVCAGEVRLTFREPAEGLFLRAEEVSAGKLVAGDWVVFLVTDERGDRDERDTRGNDGAGLEEFSSAKKEGERMGSLT